MRLPGDVLVLSRRFSLIGGFAARIERIPAAAIRAGAVLRGAPVAVFRPPLTLQPRSATVRGCASACRSAGDAMVLPSRSKAEIRGGHAMSHTISRRRLLQFLAAGSAVGGGLSLAACVPEEPPTGQHALSDTGPPLRALAAERGLTIGTAILAFQLWELEYARLIERHFSQITEEGAGFMTEIQPTRGKWTFAGPRSQFAEVRDQTLRIQALVWGHETATSEDFFHGWTPTPEWVRNDWSRTARHHEGAHRHACAGTRGGFGSTWW